MLKQLYNIWLQRMHLNSAEFFIIIYSAEIALPKDRRMDRR